MNTAQTALNLLRQIGRTEDATELRQIVAQLAAAFPEHALLVRQHLETETAELIEQLCNQYRELAVLRYHPRARLIVTRIQQTLKEMPA